MQSSASKSPADSTPATVSRGGLAFVFAFLTGILTVLAFPDWNLDLLVWIILVPLFLCARGAGGWRGFFLGWLAGLTLEGVGFLWIFYAIRNYTGFNGLLSPVAFVFFLGWLSYSSLSWALLGCLLGRCRKQNGIFAVILLWVALEHYYPRLFPWHLGGVFYQREWLRQAADLLGASGLTFLVLLGNATVYLVMEWRRRRCPFPRWSLAGTVLLLAGALLYGRYREQSIDRLLESSPELRIGIIQPCMEPAAQRSKEALLQLLEQSWELARTESPDLILWPEGADPKPIFLDPKEGADPLKFHRPPSGGRTIFDGIPVPLVVGGTSFEGKDRVDRVWNTAAYILPLSGASQEEAPRRVQLYHKNIRLLFGEKVPLEDYFPEWLRSRISVGTIEAGKECPIFLLPGGKVGSYPFRILICYEAVLPGYVRKASDDVSFLVNITEDIWYGKTAHTGQHVSVMIMRVTENRVPLVRCTNVGPSGVVDQAGRFIDTSHPFAPDVLIARLRPGTLFSLYRAGGFLFPLLCLILGGAAYLKCNIRNIYGFK